jgi:cysteine-S-conjugate beta-lyase
MESLKKTSTLIHHPYRAPVDFEAPQVATHKASTVFFPSVKAMHGRDWKDKSGYTYGLHGTPTTFTLEERLCAVEGGLHCMLVPSGLTAIALVNLALLRTGDEVLLPDNVYGPNKSLVQAELQQWGIGHRFYDPLDVHDLAAKMSAATRLVWLEAPGSVTMEFPDLLAQVQLCRDKDVCCVLDNTWGAGLAFNAFDLTPQNGSHSLGVDITVHALTKYPSGGGDVLMGSVMTRDPDLANRLKLCHMRLGLMVGANDAETVLRSLPSMALRYRAQDICARNLARWCQTLPQVMQVLHPALEASPGHGFWKQICTPVARGHLNPLLDGVEQNDGWAAALFSIVIDPRFTTEQVHHFCDALNLFKLGYSWAGPISLVVPYELQSMRSAWPAAIQKGHVVRFSIGLEAEEDLQNDLHQAFVAGLGA